MNNRPAGPDFTEQDLSHLCALLDELGSAMSGLEAYGFMTALASAPTLSTPSTWLPTILGDCGSKPHAHVEKATLMLVDLWNEIGFGLDNTKKLPASEDLDELEPWCRGYLRATRLNDDWRGDRQAVTLLMPMAILSGEFDLVGEQDRKGNTIVDATPQKMKCAENLAEVVAVLHLHWAERRQGAQRTTDVRSSANKIGRNEECPCGSGKKYKKCCGRSS